MIIDAKSIYDCVVARTQVISLTEKRTALELLGYLENTRRNGCGTRWVNGESNLSDAMTKIGADEALRLWISTGQWAIIYDSQLMSGRKRRAAGLARGELPDHNAAVNQFLADLDAWKSEYLSSEQT